MASCISSAVTGLSPLNEISPIAPKPDHVEISIAKRFLSIVDVNNVAPPSFRNRCISFSGINYNDHLITTQISGHTSLREFEQLNSFVVEEKQRSEKCRQQNLLRHLDFTLSQGIGAVSSISLLGVPPLLSGHSLKSTMITSHSPPRSNITLSTDRRTMLHTARHYIGQNELLQLHNMTKLTPLDVSKLSSIFALGETHGLLSASAFWSLLSVQHGGSLLLQPDLVVPMPDWTTVEPVASLHQQKKTFLSDNALIGSRIFSFFDTSCKEGLTFQEFALAVAVLCQQATFIDMSSFVFEVLDLRADGLISLDELMMCATAIDLASSRAHAANLLRSDVVDNVTPHPEMSPVSTSTSTTSCTSITPAYDYRSPMTGSMSKLGSPFAAGILPSSRLMMVSAATSIRSRVSASPAQKPRHDTNASVQALSKLYTDAIESTHTSSRLQGHLSVDEFDELTEQRPQLLELFCIPSFSELCNAIMMQLRNHKL